MIRGDGWWLRGEAGENERGSSGKELEVGSRGNLDQGVFVHNGSQVEECSGTSECRKVFPG